MGSPNSSVPVVGNFDTDGPTEPGVFTINGQGQGVWTIGSATHGHLHRGLTARPATSRCPVTTARSVTTRLAVYRPGTGQFLVL